MSKIIGAINMTLDAYCDHTAIVPDEEVHEHYTKLLGEGEAILYGRITYELMEFWQPMVNEPTGEKAMDDFALAIHKIPKIVFSSTLQNVAWESARLATGSLEEEVTALKANSKKAIFVGCRSLIIQLLKLRLIDELQICIHPVIAGSGLPLFEDLNDRTLLTLEKTKTFGGGAVVHYYATT
jgi:dihydrofolate reductase